MEPYKQQTVEPSSENTREKDHTIASRSLVATACGVVLAGKVNNIGLVMDANHLLNKKNHTLWQKICSPFNKELWHELKAEFKSVMERENKGVIATIPKVLKYSVVTTVIGGAIGAALGWKLGGRIDNWKDIIKHPWESSKILFAIKKPAPATKETEVVTAGNVAQDNSVQSNLQHSTNWREFAKEQQNKMKMQQNGIV
jgi:hypothetical protein